MKAKTIEAKDVGFLVTVDNGKLNETYIEEDIGLNCYGDIGYFYRDSSQDIPGGGICYAAEVPSHTISFDDPDFNNHAYTYDDVLRVCEGVVSAAKHCLEVAGGTHIEVVWTSIEEAYYQTRGEIEYDE